MSDNSTPRRCQSCVYWRQLRSGGHGATRSDSITSAFVCHYILDKGVRRKRDGKTCLSYEKQQDRRQKKKAL